MAKLALVLVFVFLFCVSQVASEASAFGYGNRFAVICNGDVDDFGWNANVNEGRVAVEAAAMISGTLWLPNIQKEDLEKTVDDLVEAGVLVIITTSYGYGDVTEMLAIKYPQVSFAQYGIKSALPNLSDIVFTSLDFYYVVGVFCGATTTNGKVGIVYPGINVSNINIANTFFMGVKFANPNAEVHIVSIGSFDDPDREQGSADLLLNKTQDETGAYVYNGVGSLVGQTNGLTVPKAAMAAGLLAVGMTGYSLSSIFGQQVGMSLLKNWTTSLMPFIPALDGSVVVKQDFTGSFFSGDQIADHRSGFVTDDQWAVVTEAINNMKKRNNTYACGPFVAELGPMKSNGCLNSTSSLNTKLHSGFINWGDYRVPLIEHKFPEASTIGLIVTASVLIVATCALMFIVFLARKRESIRLGSYVFLLNMLIGTILVFGGVIAWALIPGKHSCLARVWLPSLGGTIAISALIAKNLRIMIAFSYAKQIKKAGAALLLRRFIVIAMILVFCDIPFLIAYTVVVPSGTRRLQGTEGLGKYDYRDVCASSSSSNHALYALLAYHGVQLLIGCVISYKCRIITDPKYDERKAVAFCLYGIAFCLVVFTVLVGIIGLTNTQLVMGISLALLLVNTFSVVAIFGARIMDLYVQEVDIRMPPSTNTASMSANMSPSRNTSNSGVSSKEDSSLSF